MTLRTLSTNLVIMDFNIYEIIGSSLLTDLMFLMFDSTSTVIDIFLGTLLACRALDSIR